MTTHRAESGDVREQRMRNSPPPGEAGLLGAALAIGMLLMGLQLWILTVALDAFQRHNDGQVYALAGISALIFLGGAAMLWILRRRPTVRRTSVSLSSHNSSDRFE